VKRDDVQHIALGDGEREDMSVVAEVHLAIPRLLLAQHLNRLIHRAEAAVSILIREARPQRWAVSADDEGTARGADAIAAHDGVCRGGRPVCKTDEDPVLLAGRLFQADDALAHDGHALGQEADELLEEVRAMHGALRLHVIHEDLDDALSLVGALFADLEVEPGCGLAVPAIEGRARLVALPERGGDQLDSFVAVVAEAKAGTDLAEGGCGFVDCESDGGGIGEEANGEDDTADAAAADGNVEGFGVG